MILPGVRRLVRNQRALRGNQWVLSEQLEAS